MSLVAYDSSDDSDEEISPRLQESPVRKSIPSIGPKKQRESVKITIPSLKEFEEENDEVPKKKPKFQSGSGLFSLLPPPKNCTTLNKPGFVPYVLKSKKQPTPSSVKQPNVSNPKLKTSPNLLTSVSSDQEFDDDIACGTAKSSEEGSASVVAADFFSLEGPKGKVSGSNFLSSSDKDLFIVKQPYQLPSKSTSSENDKNIIQEQSFELPSSSYTHKPLLQSVLEGTLYSQYDQIPLPNTSEIDANYEQEEDSQCSPHSVGEPDVKESLLKDKEFLKLQGRRREFENIDIIDVNAKDQLTDKNEWLMKSLTEESTYRPSRKKHNMPTQQQKRKHQITYLAFQAKEREMDLKNQWALNSRTKRETQAKYGF